MWYTSQSPQNEGFLRCPMARFLGTHAGPHGTGYRRVRQHIPLATGSGVHKGLELIGEWLLDWQERHGLVAVPDQPTLREVIAWAAAEAARTYASKAEKKGFVELERMDSTDQALAKIMTETLIKEQATLIEGQVWVWGILQLPNLLATHYVLQPESEECLILDCSCGLGMAVVDPRTHAARGCTGIVQQGRPDWLIAHRETHQPVYLQFKTKATASVSWELAWSHNMALLIDMEAASRRLGKSVREAFVHVLYKGYFGRDRNAPPEARKYQHSPLCYGYYQAAVPPMREAQWASQYDYVGPDGKGHKLPKTFDKVPIWDESRELLPVRPDASRVETWVTREISQDQWAGLLNILGPFTREENDRRLQQAYRSFVAEEQTWQARVSYLRDTCGVTSVSSPSIDDIVPRSYACTDWSGNPCVFLGICNGDVEADDPVGSGKFTIRTPHHQLEREAFEAIGVVFPGEDDEDEEQD